MTGILMLTLLQAVVSSAGATGRLGALLAGAGTVVEHLSSPSIPAIPDLRVSSNITGRHHRDRPGRGQGSTPPAPRGERITPTDFRLGGTS